MRKLLLILTLLLINNSYGFNEPNVSMKESELYTVCDSLIKQSEIKVPGDPIPTRFYDCLIIRSKSELGYCDFEEFSVTTHSGEVSSVSRSSKPSLSNKEKKKFKCK